MASELIVGLSAFKTMFDIAKSLKDMSDAVTRNAAVANLWEQILSTQARYAAAVQQISDLEKEVARFETWTADKQRYELKDVGLGSLAYAVKEGMRGTDPPHQICAACYQHGNKSILQPRDIKQEKMLICSECKAQIKVADIPYNFA